MKKVILLLAIMAPGAWAKAQIIDTAVHAFPSCKVVPFYNNPRTDTVQITHVAVISGNFDFIRQCITINYEYCGGASSGVTIAQGSVTLTGSDFVSGQQAVNKLMFFFTYLGAHVAGGLTYQ